MIQINKDVYFTFSSAVLAARDEISSLESAHLLEIGGASENGTNLQLSVIHSFCLTVSSTIDDRPSVPIVICPECDSPSSLRCACLLCGAYMLLCDQVGLEVVISTFSDINPCGSKAIDNTILNCWTALHHARDLHWLGVQCDGAEPALDLELVSHYALAANGGVRVLVPGKLLLVPCPASLPVGQDWADVSEDERPAERRFSARFLADVLVDLDASVVAWLERAGEGDAEAMKARGLDVHELYMDARRPALLQTMDRLLTVSRAAPGSVAVLCSCGSDATVGTMAAAWLMTLGFDEGAAGAWLRLLCPSLSGPVPA